MRPRRRVRGEGKIDGGEAVRGNEVKVRRQHERPGRDRQPRCCRVEIGAAARIGEHGQSKTGEQKERPIFAEHGGPGRQSRQHGEAGTAAFERDEKPPRGRCPERREHRARIELQRVKIIERQQA
jgi:hypothetical protein